MSSWELVLDRKSALIVQERIEGYVSCREEQNLHEMALSLGCDGLMGLWWQGIKCWRHFISENKDRPKHIRGS